MIGAFVEFPYSHPRKRPAYVGYVVLENGCFQWTGATMSRGYGTCCVNGRTQRAHRFYYERAHGPIADGLTLDHLCRNRLCVRPEHLEPVLNRTNVLRGAGVSAENARKTHCKRGHLFDQQNTRYAPTGARICRACHAAYMRKWNCDRGMREDSR